MIQPLNSIRYVYPNFPNNKSILPSVTKSQSHQLPALDKPVSTPTDVFQNINNLKATAKIQTSFQPASYSAIGNSGINLNNTIDADRAAPGESFQTVTRYDGDLAKRAYLQLDRQIQQENVIEEEPKIDRPFKTAESQAPHYQQVEAPEPFSVPEFSNYEVPSYDQKEHKVGSEFSSEFPVEDKSPAVANIEEPQSNTVTDEFYSNTDNYLNLKAIEAYGMFTSPAYQNTGNNFNYMA